MFRLDNNPVKARRQIEELKIVTRREPTVSKNPDNPSIPKDHTLTGRQMYFQFCYRMSKFDEEFAHLDPIIAQSWLNLGMTRLIHEFEKRLLSDSDTLDRSVWPVFEEYSDHYDLELDQEETIEGIEYVFSGPKTFGGETLKILDENFLVYVSPIEEFVDLPGCRLPNWWPYERVIQPGLTYWKGKSLVVDWVECEEKGLSFLTSNAFSSLRDGMNMKVFVRRESAGFPIHIYVDSEKNRMRGSGGFINKSALPPNSLVNGLKIRFKVDKVLALFYDIDQLMKDCHIETDSDHVPRGIPDEYCYDVVDYGIDAYFESMYQHNFGKYNAGVSRQDSTATSAEAANMPRKTDAVPPQRYHMQGG